MSEGKIVTIAITKKSFEIPNIEVEFLAAMDQYLTAIDILRSHRSELDHVRDVGFNLVTEPISEQGGEARFKVYVLGHNQSIKDVPDSYYWYREITVYPSRAARVGGEAALEQGLMLELIGYNQMVKILEDIKKVSITH